MRTLLFGAVLALYGGMAVADSPEPLTLTVKDAMVSTLISNMQGEGNRFYRIDRITVDPPSGNQIGATIDFENPECGHRQLVGTFKDIDAGGGTFSFSFYVMTPC